MAIDIVPVLDTPALLMGSDERILVVSDIHLGYEYELLKKGINIPNQTNYIKNYLKELITENNAKKLILLGDVKHNIPNISALEAKSIPKFMDLGIPYKLIKGNHDGNIENLIGHPTLNHLLIDGILFVHGHMKVPDVEFDTLITGHSHPAIEITDELGKRTKEKCWVRGRFPSGEGIIIMPSFNPLITGISFNREGSKIPGTMFKRFTTSELKMEAYLMDGTFLGRISDIR